MLLYHSFEADSVVLPSGATASVAVTTDYPFDEVVNVNFTSAAAITIALRIPGWCPELTGEEPRANTIQLMILLRDGILFSLQRHLYFGKPSWPRSSHSEFRRALGI